MTGESGLFFYFLVGTQHLYGEETLKKVDSNAGEIVDFFNSSDEIPCEVRFLTCLTDSEAILSAVRRANNDEYCAGIIAWMHTFSPSKMWIAGFRELRKPYLHLNTQFNRDIPWDSIDMDFMNLNQSAHGDREHGYIAARMRLNRKVIAGYYRDSDFCSEIAAWMTAAVGIHESRHLRVLRISDNMRNVAVTEGDKVEAQLKLGWQVDHYGVGDIACEVETASENEIDAQIALYEQNYIIDTSDIESVRYQARLEIALKKFLEKGNFGAFHTNFEDLHALSQLPGLAAQDLMRMGYGFGAEGDWKVAAMTRVMKRMAAVLGKVSPENIKGTAFMEDYTYHFERGNEMILGAHMLEVCPTLADEKAKIQVHPLGIGGKEPPARAVFKAKKGSGIVVSLVDMGDRLRMIVNDIECIAQEHDMPCLPVAGVLWRPLPSLKTSAECWILAGGAHHSVLSYDLNASHMRDFAEIAGIEFLHIGSETNVIDFRKELMYNDVIYKSKY